MQSSPTFAWEKGKASCSLYPANWAMGTDIVILLELYGGHDLVKTDFCIMYKFIFYLVLKLFLSIFLNPFSSERDDY